MKKIFIVFFILFFASCEKDPDVNVMNADYFRVDLQSGYNHTYTQLLIDDNTVFQDTLTTINGYGLAKSKHFTITTGVHHIECITDDCSGDTIFTITDSLVIGIIKGSLSNKIFSISIILAIFLIMNNPTAGICLQNI